MLPILEAVAALCLASGMSLADIPSGVPMPEGFTGVNATYSRRADHEQWSLSLPGADGLGPEEVTLEGEFRRLSLLFQTAVPLQANLAARYLAQLSRSGWEVLERPRGSFPTVVARRFDRDQKEWLRVRWSGREVDLTWLRESPGRELILSPPSAVAEDASGPGDFPFLGHLPETTLTETAVRSQPLEALVDIGLGIVRTWTADGPVVEKRYRLEPHISSFEGFDSYQTALARSGWTLEHAARNGTISRWLTAHYQRGERNLWAFLSFGPSEYVFRVADQGATTCWDHVSRELAESGRFVFRGINFGEGSDKLLAESEPILRQVLDVLRREPSLKISIECHTDGEGGAKANQALSLRRAETLKTYWVAHGIEESRLSVQGRGDTEPLAENGTRAGRALNRRIELLNPSLMASHLRCR